MENLNKEQEKLLVAIHDTLVYARKIAFESKNKTLFDFLDYAEYLPALIIEKKDNLDVFENCLKEMSDKFDCQHIYNKFKNT